MKEPTPTTTEELPTVVKKEPTTTAKKEPSVVAKSIADISRDNSEVPNNHNAADHLRKESVAADTAVSQETRVEVRSEPGERSSTESV
ncbi:hypothetical protein BGZ73_001423, partial [Actinomortierella ambigua]